MAVFLLHVPGRTFYVQVYINQISDVFIYIQDLVHPANLEAFLDATMDDA